MTTIFGSIVNYDLDFAVQNPPGNRIVLLIMNVYRLAKQFQMSTLEQLCIIYLETTFNIQNVLEALRYVSSLELNLIKNLCLKFTVRIFPRQAYCKENLEMNVSAQNVLEILDAANSMQIGDMKSYAIELMVQNFAQVAMLPKIRFLSRDLVLGILEALAREMKELKKQAVKLCQKIMGHNFLFRESFLKHN